MVPLGPILKSFNTQMRGEARFIAKGSRLLALVDGWVALEGLGGDGLADRGPERGSSNLPPIGGDGSRVWMNGEL